VVAAPVVHQLRGPATGQHGSAGVLGVDQILGRSGLADVREPVVQALAVRAAQVVVGSGDVTVERDRHREH
jgi:hypothetical protein